MFIFWIKCASFPICVCFILPLIVWFECGFAFRNVLQSISTEKQHMIPYLCILQLRIETEQLNSYNFQRNFHPSISYWFILIYSRAINNNNFNEMSKKKDKCVQMTIHSQQSLLIMYIYCICLYTIVCLYSGSLNPIRRTRIIRFVVVESVKFFTWNFMCARDRYERFIKT